MNVQLRNSNGYPGHVVNNFGAKRRRRGVGQSNINPTTIWTPQTGFLNTPGTLANGYQFQPQVTSVYDVPGLLLPYQTCIDAEGGSAGSEACVNQNLATEAENFKRTAEYNAGTLKLPAGTPPPTPPPPTPVTTGVCSQPNFFNASGVCVDPFFGRAIPGVPTKTPAPPPTTPGGSTAQKVADTLTGGGGSTSTPTSPATSNSTLYWIAGLAAAGLLLYAVTK